MHQRSCLFPSVYTSPPTPTCALLLVNLSPLVYSKASLPEPMNGLTGYLLPYSGLAGVPFPILLFAPESPWHLVRHKKLEEVEKSLRWLQRQSANIDVKPS